jgi:hypothetical protein
MQEYKTENKLFTFLIALRFIKREKPINTNINTLIFMKCVSTFFLFVLQCSDSNKMKKGEAMYTFHENESISNCVPLQKSNGRMNNYICFFSSRRLWGLRPRHPLR